MKFNIKKISFLLATLLLMVASAAGQQPANESDLIHVPFSWKVGDHKHFSCERVKFKDGQKDGSTKKSIFSIEIVSETETELVASCLFSVVVKPNIDPEVAADPVFQEMVGLYDKLPIEVNISKQGYFSSLGDCTALENAIRESKESILKLVENMDFDKEGKEFLVRFANDPQRKNQAVQQILTPLNLLLLTTNVEFDPNQSLSTESSTDLFYAQDVPANDTYEITDENAQQDRIAVRYTQVVEGAVAAQMVADAIVEQTKRIAPASKPERPEVDGVLYRGTADVVISLQTGWPTTAKWESKVNDFETGELELKETQIVHEIEKHEAGSKRVR